MRPFSFQGQFALEQFATKQSGWFLVQIHIQWYPKNGLHIRIQVVYAGAVHRMPIVMKPTK